MFFSRGGQSILLAFNSLSEDARHAKRNHDPPPFSSDRQLPKALSPTKHFQQETKATKAESIMLGKCHIDIKDSLMPAPFMLKFNAELETFFFFDSPNKRRRKLPCFNKKTNGEK